MLDGQDQTQRYDATFGIGCLHFGLVDQPSLEMNTLLEPIGSFDTQQHVQNIKNALEEIANIEEVDVSVGRYQSLGLPANPPGVPPYKNLRSGLGSFPNLDPLAIDFSLYLPLRIQESLALLHGGPWSERWRYSFRSSDRLPIVFARPLDDNPDVRPSSGVVIMREFLESQAAILAKHGLRLETLGPSPFHVECLVFAADSEENHEGTFWCEHERSAGYSLVLITYSQKLSSSVEDALEAIWGDIKQEIALCYLAAQVQYLLQVEADDVRESVADVTTTQSSAGLRGILATTFSGRQLNLAFLTIAQYEDRTLNLQRFLQEERRDLNDRVTIPCFTDFVDEMIAETEVVPLTHFNNLVRLFETRRATNIGLFAVFISALIGGAIGAILTAVLSG